LVEDAEKYLELTCNDWGLSVADVERFFELAELQQSKKMQCIIGFPVRSGGGAYIKEYMFRSKSTGQ